MYARITKFQSDPAKLEEMVSRIPAIREQIAAIDGVANWAMWNEDGTGMAMAIYEDEAAALCRVLRARNFVVKDALALLEPYVVSALVGSKR